MKVLFKFAENIKFADVLKNVKESAVFNGVDKDGDDHYTITDEYFPADCDIYVKEERSSIYIKTFGGYTYCIETHNGRVNVTYEGAYRGLISQNLLPEIMQVKESYDLASLLEAKVDNSLRYGVDFSTYVEMQQKLHMLRVNEDMHANMHAHPKIVHEMIVAGMFPELPKLEVYRDGDADDIEAPIRTRLRK